MKPTLVIFMGIDYINIRNTYKELKPIRMSLLSLLLKILEIPIRNWNKPVYAIWNKEKGDIRNTYKELKLNVGANFLTTALHIRNTYKELKLQKNITKRILFYYIRNTYKELKLSGIEVVEKKYKIY